MMQYRVAHIDKTADEYEASLENKDYYADKVADLKPESRRRLEVLAVRCLLKDMMGEEQQIAYNQYGAPSFVKPSSQTPYLSISHTDGFVAAIVGGKPVGIDVERRGRRVEKVVSKFMQDAEIALVESLQNASDDKEQARFLCLHLIWSAKEAAFKVLGQEYYDLQNLTCVKEIDFINKVMKMEVNGQNPLTVHFDYTEDFVLCYLMSE